MNPLRAGLSITLVLGVSVAASSQLSGAIPRGHAHNDYRHERPLLDALEHGFASVEADIYLVDGQLLVAHDLRDVSPDRTLEKMYLAPLQARVTEHGGRVYPWLEPFVLLVDIKADSEATYAALKPMLEKYRGMLAGVDDGVVKPGPVMVILSGGYPLETVAADSSRLVAIDGRPSHLGQGYAVDLMPLISDSWHSHFKWTGSGSMPEDQRQALRELVGRVHDEGRIIRFWATPDRPELWAEETAAGVDLINADNLARLEEYLKGGNRKETTR